MAKRLSVCIGHYMTQHFNTSTCNLIGYKSAHKHTHLPVLIRISSSRAFTTHHHPLRQHRSHQQQRQQAQHGIFGPHPLSVASRRTVFAQSKDNISLFDIFVFTLIYNELFTDSIDTVDHSVVHSDAHLREMHCLLDKLSCM